GEVVPPALQLGWCTGPLPGAAPLPPVRRLRRERGGSGPRSDRVHGRGAVDPRVLRGGAGEARPYQPNARRGVSGPQLQVEASLTRRGADEGVDEMDEGRLRVLAEPAMHR